MPGKPEIHVIMERLPTIVNWFGRVDRGAELLSRSSNVKHGKLSAEFVCIRF
jgi:hypothetical protein